MIRRVSGNSMLPTLRPGRIVLARRHFYKPKIGDVVIIRHNGTEKIKRIARLDRESVFVRGDNPEESTDSRQFGSIPREAIIAKVCWARTTEIDTASA